MSKAILILDEMPECCLVCPLCQHDQHDAYNDQHDIHADFGYCVAMSNDNKIVFSEHEFCPDWCPLIESDEIEKLTPKKVVMGNYTHRCPNCNSCVEGCEKFCRECGQALDWDI